MSGAPIKFTEKLLFAGPTWTDVQPLVEEPEVDEADVRTKVAGSVTGESADPRSLHELPCSAIAIDEISRKAEVDAQDSTVGDGIPGGIVITPSQALAACRAALLKCPPECRRVLHKYRALVNHAVVQILEVVGDYELKDGQSPLHTSAVKGDLVIIQVLLAAGADVGAKDKNGRTPIDLVTDDTCRALLESHAAIVATVHSTPSVLVSHALAHCVKLSASKETTSATSAELSPVLYLLDPSFHWAPPAARAAVFAWARNVAQVQFATLEVHLFSELPDDCAGDVLDFLDFSMPHTEWPYIATNCTSLDAQAWVCAVVAAAVKAEATAELVSAVDEDDLAAVQASLAKGADVYARTNDDRTLLIESTIRGQATIAEALVHGGADIDADDEDGDTALIIAACSQGQASFVKLLLDAGANLEATNDNGYTALIEIMHQIHDPDIAIVKLLLEAGANTEATDEDGNTTLTIAASFPRSHATALKLLLDAGAKTEAKNNNGRTALIEIMHKTLKPDVAIVGILLEAGANTEATDKDGNTALIIGTRSRHYEPIVKLLLDAGAKIEAKNNIGRTALIEAVDGFTSCNVAIVKLLLEAGANTESKDKNGRTALFASVNKLNGCDDAIVSALLKAGADPEAEDENGETSLVKACSRGYATAVKLLLNAGANKAVVNMNGWPLIRVVVHQLFRLDVTIIDMLIEAGADPEAKDTNGYTALLAACCFGNFAAMKLLLDAGADPEAQDMRGNTALLEASFHQRDPAFVKLLLDRGANPEAVNESGSTPLINAVQRGEITNVEVLIKAGVDKEMIDKNNFTALFHASMLGQADIVKCLLQAGASKDYKNENGMTALIMASRNGCVKAVELLLDSEAYDINDLSVNVALILASLSGHTDVVKSLLRVFSIGNTADENYENAAPILVSSGGHTAIVERLLRASPYKDSLNEVGCTALLAAVGNGQIAVADLIVEANVDKKAKVEIAILDILMQASTNKNDLQSEDQEKYPKYTPRNGKPSIVDFLLQAGANADTKNEDGSTALVVASISGDTVIVELLLHAGADKDITSKVNKTALDYAIENNYSEIVTLLQ